MKTLKQLYSELEKTIPGSEESKRISDEILEAVMGGDTKPGSTVHERGCKCGWCKAGFTKAK